MKASLNRARERFIPPPYQYLNAKLNGQAHHRDTITWLGP
jgi:hypothetical protein